jgi:hypothetical protein
MTKQDSESKKNYSNVKTIKLDPLGERLSNIGMAGGASKIKLPKTEIRKKNIKRRLKEHKREVRAETGGSAGGTDKSAIVPVRAQTSKGSSFQEHKGDRIFSRGATNNMESWRTDMEKTFKGLFDFPGPKKK